MATLEKIREIEHQKAMIILGQMGQAPPAAASPMMMPPLGMQMKPQPPMGGGGMGGGMGMPGPARPAATSPTPLPPMGAGGQPTRPPTGDPARPSQGPPDAATSPDTKREKEVRRSLENLRSVIMELAANIYQIPLTEEQVREMSYKVLQSFSDDINDITVDRVMEIGHDLIGGVEKKKKH